MNSPHHRDDQLAGRRQDMRNRKPKFEGADSSAPRPKPRRTIGLRTVLVVLVVLLLVLGLWYTSPARLFPECRGDSVPRYCVD